MHPPIDVKMPRGLCTDCVYARLIESSKGSVFVRCDLSFVDTRFTRYPTLPVRACDGYQERPSR